MDYSEQDKKSLFDQLKILVTSICVCHPGQDMTLRVRIHEDNTYYFTIQHHEGAASQILKKILHTVGGEIYDEGLAHKSASGSQRIIFIPKLPYKKLAKNLTLAIEQAQAPIKTKLQELVTLTGELPLIEMVVSPKRSGFKIRFSSLHSEDIEAKINRICDALEASRAGRCIPFISKGEIYFTPDKDTFQKLDDAIRYLGTELEVQSNTPIDKAHPAWADKIENPAAFAIDYLKYVFGNEATVKIHPDFIAVTVNPNSPDTEFAENRLSVFMPAESISRNEKGEIHLLIGPKMLRNKVMMFDPEYITTLTTPGITR